MITWDIEKEFSTEYHNLLVNSVCVGTVASYRGSFTIVCYLPESMREDEDECVEFNSLSGAKNCLLGVVRMWFVRVADVLL